MGDKRTVLVTESDDTGSSKESGHPAVRKTSLVEGGRMSPTIASVRIKFHTLTGGSNG